jgi:hypothetical protein
LFSLNYFVKCTVKYPWDNSRLLVKCKTMRSIFGTGGLIGREDVMRYTIFDHLSRVSAFNSSFE